MLVTDRIDGGDEMTLVVMVTVIVVIMVVMVSKKTLKRTRRDQMVQWEDDVVLMVTDSVGYSD